MDGEVLVALGLRTGIGKEAVMAAAVGEEAFNMVKGGGVEGGKSYQLLLKYL